MTTHFCPQYCGECPGCKQSFADLEAYHEAQYQQYANDWKGSTNEQQASGNRPESASEAGEYVSPNQFRSP